MNGAPRNRYEYWIVLSSTSVGKNQGKSAFFFRYKNEDMQFGLQNRNRKNLIEALKNFTRSKICNLNPGIGAQIIYSSR